MVSLAHSPHGMQKHKMRSSRGSAYPPSLDVRLSYRGKHAEENAEPLQLYKRMLAGSVYREMFVLKG